MKKRFRKITMVLLVIAMVISTMPFAAVTVSAANTADSLVAIAEGELGNTNYSKYYGGNKGAWCADFVTWCAQQAGVTSIAYSSSCYYMYNGMIANECQLVSSPQKGDIVFFYCNNCSGTANKWCHVGIMVNSTTSIDGNYSGKVSYDNSYSHYGSLGYKHSSGINKIYVRPNYSNIPNNFPGEEDTSWNVPVWKTANSKLNTYNDAGIQESGRWIDAGDNCYIEKVYQNGFVRVMYPTSSGDRWAYARADGFSLEKKQTTYNPQGYFDWVKSENSGEIHLRGWAFDRDDLNASIKLHVYVNNSHYATITADKSRSDVNDAYPGVGNNHGFEDTLIVNKSGSLNIKVYAINIGSGSDVLIKNGEKAVTITADSNTPKCMKTCMLDGHTYKLYACSTTWENAKIWCEENDGYLATITSQREQYFLYKLLSEYSPLNFYLGGYSASGSWKWVTEETFSYTAWAANQPDCAGNAEFYLGAYKHSDTSEDLNFWNDFTNNYHGMTGFIYESDDSEEIQVLPSNNLPTISYSVLTGDTWNKNSTNGEAVGKENENRFKAVKISLENCLGGIKYAAHFSNTGWSNYVSDNEICGSTNDTSSIEAIKMELYGDIASSYNVFYCVYVRDKGWLGWAKNGETAGSTGGSLPITAIKIMLVPQIRYSSHIENYGWLNSVNDKEISGTVGESLRLEALKISLTDTAYGNIIYKTHVEDLGWGNSVYNGKASGTSNLKLRTEAFTISLDGKANELFDIMYKAHIKDIGWTNWERNGTIVGTVGESLRLEAFKAMIVPKGYTGAETYKEYTAEHYTVQFNSMGGECNVKSKEVSYCNFYKDLPTPTKVNYVFAGWYDSLDYTNEITLSSTLETKSNVTLYAKWMVTGDTNNDGVLNVDDTTTIQKYLAQLVPFDDDQLKVADTNGDGRINITDVTHIQKYLADIIPELG